MEEGKTTDFERGRRWMQTLRKLPMAAPKQNTKRGMAKRNGMRRDYSARSTIKQQFSSMKGSMAFRCSGVMSFS